MVDLAFSDQSSTLSSIPSPQLSCASSPRGIDVVRQEIQDFASTKTIFSNKFKLIILDECDAMTRDAQMALRRGKDGQISLVCPVSGFPEPLYMPPS